MLQLYLNKVSVTYENPSPVDTCRQYTDKMVFDVRQAYDVGNISVVPDASIVVVEGPINVTVAVIDGNTNDLGEMQYCWRSRCRNAPAL